LDHAGAWGWTPSTDPVYNFGKYECGDSNSVQRYELLRNVQNPASFKIKTIGSSPRCLDRSGDDWQWRTCQDTSTQQWWEWGGTPEGRLIRSPGTETCLDLGNSLHRHACDATNGNQVFSVRSFL